MRRKGKEIRDEAAMEKILGTARYLVLGIHDDPAPYLVPLFYGFEGGEIFIHCAMEGRKLDLIRANPMVSFAAVEEPKIEAGDEACRYSAVSKSVVGYGIARLITDETERKRALDAVMRHYATGGFVYDPKSFGKTCVIALDVKGMRGRGIGSS